MVSHLVPCIFEGCKILVTFKSLSSLDLTLSTFNLIVMYVKMHRPPELSRDIRECTKPSFLLHEFVKIHVVHGYNNLAPFLLFHMMVAF